MTTPHYPSEARAFNGFGLVLLILLVSPVRTYLQDGVSDDFPLSYYPMFTSDRGETTAVHHVIGTKQGGGQVLLSGRCFGAGGMNTVRRQLRRWYREGRGEEILDRVLPRLRRCYGGHQRLVAVSVVKSHYLLKSASTASPTLLQREVAGVRTLETRE